MESYERARKAWHDFYFDARTGYRSRFGCLAELKEAFIVHQAIRRVESRGQ